MPIFTAHLRDHRASVVEVRLKHMKASKDAVMTESEELDRLLFQNFRKGKVGHPREISLPHPFFAHKASLFCQLHRAVSKSGSTDSELNYLRQVVSLVLPLICPKKEFSSPSARLMLRELIVCKLVSAPS